MHKIFEQNKGDGYWGVFKHNGDFWVQVSPWYMHKKTAENKLKKLEA